MFIIILFYVVQIKDDREQTYSKDVGSFFYCFNAELILWSVLPPEVRKTDFSPKTVCFCLRKSFFIHGICMYDIPLELSSQGLLV